MVLSLLTSLIYWWGAAHGESKAAAPHLVLGSWDGSALCGLKHSVQKPYTGKVLELTHLTSWQAAVTQAGLAKWLLIHLHLSCLFKGWREVCLVYDLPKPMVKGDLNIFSVSATKTPRLLPWITGSQTHWSYCYSINNPLKKKKKKKVFSVLWSRNTVQELRWSQWGEGIRSCTPDQESISNFNRIRRSPKLSVNASPKANHEGFSEQVGKGRHVNSLQDETIHSLPNVWRVGRPWDVIKVASTEHSLPLLW